MILQSERKLAVSRLLSIAIPPIETVMQRSVFSV